MRAGREGLGARGGIRTHDIQNHNLALLPAELHAPQLLRILTEHDRLLPVSPWGAQLAPPSALTVRCARLEAAMCTALAASLRLGRRRWKRRQASAMNLARKEGRRMLLAAPGCLNRTSSHGGGRLAAEADRRSGFPHGGRLLFGTGSVRVPRRMPCLCGPLAQVELPVRGRSADAKRRVSWFSERQ